MAAEINTRYPIKAWIWLHMQDKIQSKYQTLGVNTSKNCKVYKFHKWFHSSFPRVCHKYSTNRTFLITGVELKNNFILDGPNWNHCVTLKHKFAMCKPLNTLWFMFFIYVWKFLIFQFLIETCQAMPGNKLVCCEKCHFATLVCSTLNHRPLFLALSSSSVS